MFQSQVEAPKFCFNFNKTSCFNITIDHIGYPNVFHQMMVQAFVYFDVLESDVSIRNKSLFLILFVFVCDNTLLDMELSC